MLLSDCFVDTINSLLIDCFGYSYMIELDCFWMSWLIVYDPPIFAIHVDLFLVPTVLFSPEVMPNVSFSHRISSSWPLVSGDNPYKIILSMYARISNLQFCSYKNGIWNNWNSKLDPQSILPNHQSFCHIAYNCRNSLSKSNFHYPKPKVRIATQRRVTFWTVETMNVPSIVA